MAVVFVGFPNHPAQAYVDVATSGGAGLFPATMPVTNLSTEEPSEIARWTSLDPAHTQAGFSTSGIPITIDALSIYNHNLTFGGQFRFVAAASQVAPIINPPQKLAPSAIAASTNATGAVTNVDEDIYAPDGLLISPTSTTTDWSVTFDFATPSGTIRSGTGLLCFVVRAKRMAGGGEDFIQPKCQCTLKENGTTIRDLGYRAVTTTTSGGQIFIFTFSKSELADGTGAGIQCALSFTTGTSLSGNQYAVLDTVALYYEIVSANTFTFDSGWIDIPGDYTPAPDDPIKMVHYVPDTPWTLVTAYVLMLRCDQAIHSPTLNPTGGIPAGVIPREPDNFLQVGVFCAGAGLILSEGVVENVYAPPTRIVVTEVSGVTAAGMAYGADAFRGVVSDPITFLVTRDELKFIQRQIGFKRGRSGAFYTILESDVDLDDQQFSAFWGVAREISAPTWAGNSGGTDMYKITMTFEAKL